MKERTLAEEAADVLAVSLDGRAIVAGSDGHVLITVTPDTFQFHLDDVLQHVSVIVGQAFPSRTEDIQLLIRDEDGKQHQQISLRHTTDR